MLRSIPKIEVPNFWSIGVLKLRRVHVLEFENSTFGIFGVCCGRIPLNVKVSKQTKAIDIRIQVDLY
jgi:hypothetical protein